MGKAGNNFRDESDYRAVIAGMSNEHWISNIRAINTALANVSRDARGNEI